MNKQPWYLTFNLPGMKASALPIYSCTLHQKQTVSSLSMEDMEMFLTLSLLLVHRPLEEALSVKSSFLSFLFYIQIGDRVSNSLQPKMPLNNFDMFHSILSLSWSLLFQGSSSSLGQSKLLLSWTFMSAASSQ